MGSRGPRPDPASQRSAAGRNTLHKPPQAPCELPPCPERISGRATAGAFWERHAATLHASGRLRPEMIDAFAQLCELHADCLQLSEQLAAEGWITATDKGQAASPVAKLLRDCRRDFISLAKEFGMTAAADSRLPKDATDGQEETDPEALLLSQLSIRSS